MAFDWKNLGLKLLTLAPIIVGGIEQIHGATMSGASKKDLAIGSLMLATGVADQVLPPEQAGIADAVSNETGNLISALVNIFNATGVFTHKTTNTAVPQQLP